MSKKLTKLTITLLSVMFCVCLLVASASIKPTYADNGPVTTFKMNEGASIRVTEPMGLRFVADMSADDYETLMSKNAEFGFIIAPSDWIDDKEFTLAGMTDDQTQDEYLVSVSATPQKDVDDYDGDKVKDEYVLLLTFYGIQEYNYSRPFSARAYYVVDGVPTYTENIAERAVYTVAAKAIRSKTITSTKPGYDFCKDIADTVDAVYTKDTLEVSGLVINGNSNFKVAGGTKISIKAFVTNPETGRKLLGGYLASRSSVGAATYVGPNMYLDDWDIANDTFVAGTTRFAGHEQDKLGYGDGMTIYFDLAHSAPYQYVNIIPALIIVNADFEDTSVAQNFAGDNLDITVVEAGKVVENPNIKVTNSQAVSNNALVKPTITVEYYSKALYEDAAEADKKVYSTSTALSTSVYVNRAIEYGTYQPVEGEEYEFDATSDTIPSSTYAVPGIKTGSARNSALMIKNVELDSSDTAETKQLVRFQAIPTKTGGSQPSSMRGPRRIYVSFIDADNPSDYITFVISPNGSSGTNTNNYVRVGARASNWADLRGANSGKDNMKGELWTAGARNFMAVTKWSSGKPTTYSGISNVTGTSQDNISGWSAGLEIGSFNLCGKHLAETENPENYMMGISIKGSKLYVTNGGKTTEVWDFVEWTKSYGATLDLETATNVAMNPTTDFWYGFGKTADTYVTGSSNVAGKKINICITSDQHRNSNNMSYLLIDTIGGVQVTEANANDFINNMSYVTVGDYFVPQA